MRNSRTNTITAARTILRTAQRIVPVTTLRIIRKTTSNQVTENSETENVQRRGSSDAPSFHFGKIKRLTLAGIHFTINLWIN